MDLDVEKAINALGALCEIAGFMFKQLQVNGFTRDEAFQIASSYILEIITNNDHEDKQYDD